MDEIQTDYKQQIKELREKRGEGIKPMQERSREQLRIQKAILTAIENEAKTVPEIAETTGMSAQDVFWWITAMRKYGKVSEEKKQGDYIAYRKK